MGSEPTLYHDRLPLCYRQEAAHANSWYLSGLTYDFSEINSQAMSHSGPEPLCIIRSETSSPMPEPPISSLVAPLPNCITLPTFWNKEFMDVWAMKALWQSKLAIVSSIKFHTIKNQRRKKWELLIGREPTKIRDTRSSLQISSAKVIEAFSFKTWVGLLDARPLDRQRGNQI